MADEVGESLKLNIKITSTGEKKLKIIADSAATLLSVLGGVVAPINELNAVSSSINTNGIKSVKAVMKDTAKPANEVAKAAKGAAKELENVKVGDNISNGIKNVALSSEKVSENLDRAQKSAGELGSSFQQVKQETAKVSEAVEQASEDDIAEAQKTAQAKAALLEKYNVKIRESLKTATEAAKFTPSNTLTDVQSAKNAAFSALAGTGLNIQTNQFAQTFASVEKALEKVENIKPLNKLIAQLRSGTITAGEFAKELEKINTAVKQTGGASARSGLKDFFKKLKDDANGAIKPISKLFKTIGRLALYRAIRAMLRGITDGFKTGIQNLARYSSEANASMSKLATASLYIKNSLGAAAMPIIQQMLPALLKLANYAVKALNAINQLMSALQGKSTYTRAKEYAVDYAATLDKSTSNASKSVQKLKRDLMGFDELNVLSAPDTGASAGGGGEDYSQMFEEAEISKEFEKAAKIVEKLKDNLDVVLGIVGAIGAGVASWRLAKFLGSLDESLSKVDLLKKSLSFAAGVTLTVIGITLLIKGIKSIVLEGINAENFAQMLGGALAVTGGGALIGLTFGNALLGAGIAAIVGGAAMIGAGIYSAVEEGLNLKNGALITLGTTFVGAGIGALFGPVGAGIGALIGLATGLIVDFVIWLSKNWDSVKQTLSDLWDWIKEHIITPIANSAQPIIDVITNIWGHIKEIAEGIIAAFTAVWQKISEIVDTIVQILKAVFGWIGGKIKDGVTWIIEKITPIVNFIKEKIIDPIWNVISNLNDKVGKLFSTIATKISDGMSKMIKGALNAVFGVVEKPINGFIDALNFVVGVVNKIPGVNINRVEKISIPRFANGGMPEDGLFMANHNELVGQFSNGRTAVANNAQIQAGIEEAAYRGFMRAMSQSGGMGGQGGTYKFVAQLNGKTLFEEVVNQNNSTVKSTGNTPLLV